MSLYFGPSAEYATPGGGSMCCVPSQEGRGEGATEAVCRFLQPRPEPSAWAGPWHKPQRRRQLYAESHGSFCSHQMCGWCWRLPTAGQIHRLQPSNATPRYAARGDLQRCIQRQTGKNSQPMKRCSALPVGRETHSHTRGPPHAQDGCWQKRRKKLPGCEVPHGNIVSGMGTAVYSECQRGSRFGGGTTL